jgi:hypothetical protein
MSLRTRIVLLWGLTQKTETDSTIQSFSFPVNLLYYAFSIVDHITSNGRMIDELESICKEAVVIYFSALSQHPLTGTEEIHE